MRRKRHEEHVNHEAWAIPYADLMTLLLAFFVVMYAVSVVNAGKYRVMSQSMVDAFNGYPTARVPAASAGSESPPSSRRAPESAMLPLPSGSLAVPLHPPSAKPTPEEAAKTVALQHIEEQVQQAMQPLIDRKLVILRRTRDRLEIEIRTDILYSSGAAQLSTSASRVLVSLASILARFPNPLRVEGFTDNRPIRTSLYPSNWELSAARAASVARLFAEQGVDRARLGIVGWSDVRPVADNATAGGRQRNRRVLIVVEGGQAGTGRMAGIAEHSGDGAGSDAAAGTVTMLPTSIVSAHAAKMASSAGAASPFHQSPAAADATHAVSPLTPAMVNALAPGMARGGAPARQGPVHHEQGLPE